MASIIKKTIRGKPYYYARESQRVGGKPKIVWQKYLGTPQQIIDVMTGKSAGPAGTVPKEALITDFGAVAALHDLCQRLELAETIDKHVPKRGNVPSVGQYLTTAAINRCVAPRSKAKLGEWFEGTALRRMMSIQTKQLTSQRFWDNMDRVSDQAIAKIEEELTAKMVKDFEIDLRRVLFDGTNFFTFIDTFNERCTIAQRGKSKEGRRALRIVGLALLVSADFHVPLFHRTYPGNEVDAPTFNGLIADLSARYKAICEEAEKVTVVFDKGNNSEDNLALVEESPYCFVGSLVPTHHNDLLEIPAKRYRSLADEGLEGVRVFRTEKEVFGKRRTVLVTYNDNLFVAQSKTILREVGKRQQALREIQAGLRRRREGKVTKGKPPTVKGIENKVAGLLKGQHMKDLFHVEVTGQDGLPRLTYRFDKTAWERMQRTLLGKTIIFTDNDHWGDAEIVRGYRSQYHVEDSFRTMKDPHHIAIRPQRHWTDQKITVHVFYCVLALMLVSLLRRELHQCGIDKSIPDIIDTLAGIREVGLIHPPDGKKKNPTIKTVLSKMSAEQQAMYDALDLERYRSI
jgi:transposase